ncbi:MAG: outer membrane lipoprotein-sorting protein, partial [Cyclobacteriaceae bacterium]|nr:outer membrane lipoprotein-sorting protein [Cyclobacteriaceae bacterium]
MNKLKLSLLLFTLFSLPAFSQTATEIIKMADEKMQGTSSKGEMVMKIIRPDWSREIRMKTWSLGTDYSLILLTAP